MFFTYRLPDFAFLSHFSTSTTLTILKDNDIKVIVAENSTKRI